MEDEDERRFWSFVYMGRTTGKRGREQAKKKSSAHATALLTINRQGRNTHTHTGKKKTEQKGR